jgi:hypothetical protein
MSTKREPSRLLQEGTDFERTLLGSWDRSGAPNDARARVLSISDAPSASPMGPRPAVATWKPLALLASAAVLAGAGAGLWANRQRVERSPPLESPSVAPPISAVEAPANAPAAAPPKSAAEPARPARGHRTHATVLKSPDRLSIREELDLIDRTQARLTAGDAPAALDLVAEYRARFPAGVLEQEADILEIEALIVEGPPARAAARALKFLELHPQSPHSARARAAIESASDQSTEEHQP